MEAEARRERDARARDRDALARVTESVDALAATFREAMEAISCDHDAWTRERREIKAAVEVAVVVVLHQRERRTHRQVVVYMDRSFHVIWTHLHLNQPTSRFLV